MPTSWMATVVASVEGLGWARCWPMISMWHFFLPSEGSMRKAPLPAPSVQERGALEPTVVSARALYSVL